MTFVIGEEGAPTRFTKPLQEPIVSDGYKLIEFAERYFKDESGKPFVLDTWQKNLIVAALERYPDDWPVENLRGRIRYRQIVISVGRQNGKTLLLSAFCIYALMFLHMPDPTVIGLASSVDQANLLYRKVKNVIDSNPKLKRRFKTTGTRGIRRLDKPGLYMVRPASADALQGISGVAIQDEIHLVKEEQWQAMVKATTALDDAFVLGATTAGDDTSELLKNLYRQADQAIAGESERYGAFIWEAPPNVAIDDADALRAANPGVVSGRIPIERLQEQVRTQPEHIALRYTHNRFVSSSSTWIPLNLWQDCRDEIKQLDSRPVFVIDKTPNWEHGTITVAQKTQDGRIQTEVVASIVKPELDQLVNLCIELNKHNPITFAVDGYALKDLHNELKKRGIKSRSLTLADITSACSTAYALIAKGAVVHGGEPLLNDQMPFAVRKNAGDAWRINRQSSNHDIDAVLGMVMSVYLAEIEKEMPVQVF